MVVDNLSLSQLHSSMCEEEHISDGSIDAGVPLAALDMTEAMNFSDQCHSNNYVSKFVNNYVDTVRRLQLLALLLMHFIYGNKLL